MSNKSLVVTAVLILAIAAEVPRARTALKAPRVDNTQANTPEELLKRIRAETEHLLATRPPEIYQRHLHSVLALCEESVLRLHFAGVDRDEKAKELTGYLKTIESGLNQHDAQSSESYLVEGLRSLDLARISRSDGTLQFYAVSLPAHWNPEKAYPLYVQLHGRWSDLPLALVASTFSPQEQNQKANEDAIVLVPWIRGNSQYRVEHGSEPDLWEAIEDVKSFAKLDPDRWYISGHSWGGDDVWAIVLRTPDLWAAAGIMAGSPISVPGDSGLESNARYVPFYLWKGEKDPVSNRQEALDEFRASLMHIANPPKVVVAPGVGHMYRPEDASALQNWLFQHVRRRPDHFSFIVDTPQHRGIWGVSIPQKYPGAYFNLEPRVSFECWIENTTVRIETLNTNRLDVDFGPSGLNMSGQVKMIVNGRQMFGGTIPERPLSLTW